MVPGKTILEIDGAPVAAAELYRYALRFYGAEDARPSLYVDGRRVTSAWRLRCDLDVPEDTHGSAA